MKKISICLLLFFALSLVACGNDGPNEEPTYTPKYSWFSDSDLQSVGLDALSKPVCVSDEITSAKSYSMIYSVVATEEEFTNYVNVAFDYFASSTNVKLYGIAQVFSNSTDFSESYYKLVSKTDKEAYYSTNPSPMYTIIYSLTTEVGENGYLPEDKVFQFQVRYEDQKIKVIIYPAISPYENGSTKSYYKPA